jgi:hypothetical protein
MGGAIMATVTDKRLCKGTLGLANATLYAAPSTVGAIVMVKAITLCNKTNAPVTVTIKFAGTEVIATYSMPAYKSLTIPFIDQIIHASELIEGLAGTADSVTYYCSGKEVTA